MTEREARDLLFPSLPPVPACVHDTREPYRQWAWWMVGNGHPLRYDCRYDHVTLQQRTAAELLFKGRPNPGLPGTEKDGRP